jgi:serine/threonine protein kinase
MAELYLLGPLFNGNSELDQVYKIFSILGTPNNTTWSEGLRLAANMNFNFPQFNSVPLSNVITNASDEAIQLLTDMLRFDPQKRPTAQQILNHPYFSNYKYVSRPVTPQIIDGFPKPGGGIYLDNKKLYAKDSIEEFTNLNEDYDHLKSKNKFTHEDQPEILETSFGAKNDNKFQIFKNDKTDKNEAILKNTKEILRSMNESPHRYLQNPDSKRKYDFNKQNNIINRSTNLSPFIDLSGQTGDKRFHLPALQSNIVIEKKTNNSNYDPNPPQGGYNPQVSGAARQNRYYKPRDHAEHKFEFLEKITLNHNNQMGSSPYDFISKESIIPVKNAPTKINSGVDTDIYDFSNFTAKPERDYSLLRGFPRSRNEKSTKYQFTPFNYQGANIIGVNTSANQSGGNYLGSGPTFADEHNSINAKYRF